MRFLKVHSTDLTLLSLNEIMIEFGQFLASYILADWLISPKGFVMYWFLSRMEIFNTNWKICKSFMLYIRILLIGSHSIFNSVHA